eukprot:21085-Heterococcus_DN1.PRE.2
MLVSNLPPSHCAARIAVVLATWSAHEPWSAIVFAKGASPKQQEAAISTTTSTATAYACLSCLVDALGDIATAMAGPQYCIAEDSTCFEEVFTQLLAAAGVLSTTSTASNSNSNTTQQSSSSSSSSSSWSQCTSTKLKRRATWQTSSSVHQSVMVLLNMILDAAVVHTMLSSRAAHVQVRRAMDDMTVVLDPPLLQYSLSKAYLTTPHSVLRQASMIDCSRSISACWHTLTFAPVYSRLLALATSN